MRDETNLSEWNVTTNIKRASLHLASNEHERMEEDDFMRVTGR
jgi:hypothetical protein